MLRPRVAHSFEQMANDDEPKHTFAQKANTWVQTIGICIAALWGIYTFYFKEISAPKSAPVNISVNLQLKKIGTGPIHEELTAVEMKVSATNPSSREVHLLPSAWISYGVVIKAEEKNDADLAKEGTDALQNADQEPSDPIQKHVKWDKKSVVAVGRLFEDDMLKPNETASTTIIFYVPKKAYDLILLTTYMPTAANTTKTELKWTLNEQGDLDSTIYRINKKGGRIEITDFLGKDKDIEYQSAEANAAVSLWP